MRQVAFAYRTEAWELAVATAVPVLTGAVSCSVQPQTTQSLALLPLLGLRGDTAIQISGYLARLVSSPLNFVLNRNFVFKFKQDTGKTALKYALLCIVTITLSNLGVSLLDHRRVFIGGLAFLPKILMDTLLYLVNYRIQNKWIFAKSAENQEG